MKISLVIPVYQNSGSLVELNNRIDKCLDGREYEIIYVDDGSTDNSFQVLEKLHKENNNVKVIKLSRNFGQHAANQAGFNQVSGDIVVNLSADLQDPPEVIPQLIEKLESGLYDIALAVRSETDESFIKNITSSTHYKLIKLSVPSYPDKGFDFWAINAKAFKAFTSYSDVIRRNQIDLLSIGFRLIQIPYVKTKRIHGKSQYNFTKRLNISISQILSSAIWPLRLASTLGAFLTFIGFAYAAYLFLMYFLRDNNIDGWTPIMIVLLVIGGTILLMLGIIGEYLWRIYYETKQRPIYFVEQILK